MKIAVLKNMENAGIDPAASRLQSERSTIWANSPVRCEQDLNLREHNAHLISSQAPYQTRTSQQLPPQGIEPWTLWLQVICSTNWAIEAKRHRRDSNPRFSIQSATSSPLDDDANTDYENLKFIVWNYWLPEVGFEPTSANTFELEPNPLDQLGHSGI